MIEIVTEKDAKRLFTAMMKCAYGPRPPGSAGFYWRPRAFGVQFAVTDGHAGFMLDAACVTTAEPSDEWRAPEWDALSRWVRSLGDRISVDIIGALAAMPEESEFPAPILEALDLMYANCEVVGTDADTTGVDLAILARLEPVVRLIPRPMKGSGVILRRRSSAVTLDAPGFKCVVMGMRL
jgi:hypothetical protein